ncbi:MAG: hypothetical protein GY953_21640 [bacterium]|nr:hypothetical protein [bacterium]
MPHEGGHGGMRSIGLPELLIILLFGGMMMIVFVVPLLKILSKAGLSSALVVLVFVPFVGLPVLLFVIAFMDWPTLRTGPPGPGQHLG